MGDMTLTDLCGRWANGGLSADWTDDDIGAAILATFPDQKSLEAYDLSWHCEAETCEAALFVVFWVTFEADDDRPELGENFRAEWTAEQPTDFAADIVSAWESAIEWAEAQVIGPVEGAL